MISLTKAKAPIGDQKAKCATPEDCLSRTKSADPLKLWKKIVARVGFAVVVYLVCPIMVQMYHHHHHQSPRTVCVDNAKVIPKGI